jgi:hypothetical protein
LLRQPFRTSDGLRCSMLLHAIDDRDDNAAENWDTQELDN